MEISSFLILNFHERQKGHERKTLKNGMNERRDIGQFLKHPIQTTKKIN